MKLAKIFHRHLRHKGARQNTKPTCCGCQPTPRMAGPPPHHSILMQDQVATVAPRRGDGKAGRLPCAQLRLQAPSSSTACRRVLTSALGRTFQESPPIPRRSTRSCHCSSTWGVIPERGSRSGESAAAVLSARVLLAVLVCAREPDPPLSPPGEVAAPFCPRLQFIRPPATMSPALS